MSGIPDDFVLLERDSSRLQGVLTREIDAAGPYGSALVGVDQFGRRHLYVPVGDNEVPEDRHSQGVVLVEDTLSDGAVTRRYADLGCTDPGLHEVFTRLVEDAVQRIRSAERNEVVSALRSALGEWRELLRAAPRGLSTDALAGLVGELEVLGRLTVADPVRCWTGPSGALHDFARDMVHLEVKTTAAHDDSAVTVSGLDQLDPGKGTLYLAVVSLREDPAALSLGERIGRFLEAGLPRDELFDRLGQVGYVHGHDEGRGCYSVERVRVWPVTRSFPGLRRADLPDERVRGVEQVRYGLRLDAAPEPLDKEEADRVLAVLDPYEG